MVAVMSPITIHTHKPDLLFWSAMTERFFEVVYKFKTSVRPKSLSEFGHFLFEIEHQHGGLCGLRAFVSESSSCAVESLFFIVDCEDAENHGNVAVGVVIPCVTLWHT